MTKLTTCLLESGLTNAEKDILLGEGASAEELAKINPAKIHRAIAELQMANDRQAVQTMKNAANRQLVANYGGNRLQAITGLLVNDLRGKFGGISIERKALTLSNMANSEIIHFMESMESSKLQLFRGIFDNSSQTARQKAMTRSFVREIFGESSGDADAKVFAESVRNTLSKLNERYMESGSQKGELKDFNLPQKQDPVKIRKASQEQWLEYTWSKLDIKAMKAKGNLTEVELRELLKQTYRNITTEGAARIGESPAVRFQSNQEGGMTFAVDAKHRFLKFKNGDSWMDYQEKFGSDNVYMSVVDHINGMSRETALMETLGPNYSQGYAYLRNLALQGTRDAKVGKGKVQITEGDVGLKLADSYFREIKGHAGIPASDMVQAINSIKNWEISTKLGGAPLSAISDFAFGPVTKGFNGMMASVGMKNYAITLASKEGRQFAASMGLGAEYAVSRTVSALEHQNEMGTGRARSAAEFTLRTSGLAAHTTAARQSFGLDFNAHVRREAIKGWTEGSASAKAFGRYGITASDLKALSKAATEDYRGVSYIDPQKLNDDLQMKFVGMILEETDFAVPTPGVRERVLTSLASDPNTVAGAAIRAGTQFMSFPVTVMTKHWGRALTDAHLNTQSRIGYMAAAAALTTSFGAIAHMAKEVAAGREINEKYLTSGDFAMRSILQGGYLSILGDLMLKETGWEDTWSAPLTDGVMKDLVGVLVFGNISKMANADSMKDYLKEQKVGKEASDFLLKNLPGQNIWYTRLAFERQFADKLKEFADPKFKKTQRQRERELYREEGRRNWL